VAITDPEVRGSGRVQNAFFTLPALPFPSKELKIYSSSIYQGSNSDDDDDINDEDDDDNDDDDDDDATTTTTTTTSTTTTITPKTITTVITINYNMQPTPKFLSDIFWTCEMKSSY
jgi:hypothetical protein